MPLIFTTKLNNNLMKQLLSLITILVFSTSFAQELTLDKGKIYQNGVQLATFETKEVLKADLQALHLFKKAKNKESIGGFVLGLGIGATVADVVMSATTSNKKYPTAITYAGVGLIAVSIPILSGRKKLVEESVATYNSSLQDQNKTLGSNFELNMVNNATGFGIQINF